ncbi:MAG: DNA cytosine methyltransferase [Dehalococcoidia bacterium]|nr:DNA cytosine methyltransferase [Dehalococcoidia bacterium]
MDETYSMSRGCNTCESDISTLRSTALPSTSPNWPKLRIADLFSGCGGLSLGLQRAAQEFGYSVDVRLAVDSDEVAMTLYRSLFPSATTFCKPIEDLLDGEIGSRTTMTEKAVAQQVGSLDFLLGGPPCQGHSNLNNHSRRDDPRNRLYLRMARAAELLNPSAIIVENVPTVTSDVRRAAHEAIEVLEDMEYAIGTGIVDLWNLGVPQKRRRHIVVAVRGCDVDPQDVVDRLKTPVCEHIPRSVRWAISDLEDTDQANPFDSPSKPYPVNQSRINWLFENDKMDLPNELRPPCHRSDHSYTAMYGRMLWDAPAQTVTTGFNCMGQGRYVHPSRPRVITPHEAARLQMLPDFIDFASIRIRKHLAKLIGNTVPPPLSFAIGKTLIPSLIGTVSDLMSSETYQ